MTTTTDTTEVVAWRLRAPSGGKVYAFAIIGGTLVLGYGKASTAHETLRCRVTQFPSFDSAMHAALEWVREKERRDYALDVAPVRVPIGQEYLDKIANAPHGWEDSTLLAQGMHYALANGEPV